jgi:hypothetical protein
MSPPFLGGLGGLKLYSTQVKTAIVSGAGNFLCRHFAKFYLSHLRRSGAPESALPEQPTASPQFLPHPTGELTSLQLPAGLPNCGEMANLPGASRF